MPKNEEKGKEGIVGKEILTRLINKLPTSISDDNATKISIIFAKMLFKYEKDFEEQEAASEDDNRLKSLMVVSQIALILSSSDLYKKYLKTLNNDIEKTLTEDTINTIQELKNSAIRAYKETITYLKTPEDAPKFVYPPPNYDPKNYSICGIVLKSLLLKQEQKYGFNLDIEEHPKIDPSPYLKGYTNPKEFNQIMAEDKNSLRIPQEETSILQATKQPETVLHGNLTHRIQWHIILKAIELGDIHIFGLDVKDIYQSFFGKGILANSFYSKRKPGFWQHFLDSSNNFAKETCTIDHSITHNPKNPAFSPYIIHAYLLTGSDVPQLLSLCCRAEFFYAVYNKALLHLTCHEKIAKPEGKQIIARMQQIIDVNPSYLARYSALKALNTSTPNISNYMLSLSLKDNLNHFPPYKPCLQCSSSNAFNKENKAQESCLLSSSNTEEISKKTGDTVNLNNNNTIYLRTPHPSPLLQTNKTAQTH